MALIVLVCLTVGFSRRSTLKYLLNVLVGIDSVGKKVPKSKFGCVSGEYYDTFVLENSNRDLSSWVTTLVTDRRLRVEACLR